jgi:ankyrin repeat protein
MTRSRRRLDRSEIIDRDENRQYPEPERRTILLALTEAKPDIVAYLISKGANVNHMNNFHMSPLHLACRRNMPVEIVRLLVENGADVNAVSKYQGRPLDMAHENSAEPVILSRGRSPARFGPSNCRRTPARYPWA